MEHHRKEQPMNAFEVRATTGATFEIDADNESHACHRIADLHNVTVCAWRYSRRPMIRVGMGTEP
jgi:hypothetical protein